MRRQIGRYGGSGGLFSEVLRALWSTVCEPEPVLVHKGQVPSVIRQRSRRKEHLT